MNKVTESGKTLRPKNEILPENLIGGTEDFILQQSKRLLLISNYFSK